VVAPLTEAVALLALLDVPGLGGRGAFGLLNDAGSAEGALERAGGDGPSKSVEGRLRLELAAERLETLERLGAHLVAPGDPAYPERLFDLHDPPCALFARGNLALLKRPAVAIVGSRRATRYGRRVADGLARALARRGVTVVSGLAIGIDGAAHAGALEVEGPTIAVLGSGPDLLQPRRNESLGRRIVERGLVLSEYPPGVPAQPHHFPQRNRLVAALAGAVVVAEAAARSGALITVEHALDLGRGVFGIPGPVDRPTHAGVNGILQDGAGVIVDPERFAQEFAEGVGLGDAPDAGQGELFGGSGDRSGGGDSGAARPESADPRVRRILAALDAGCDTLDALQEEVELPVPETLALLAELEVSGRVCQDDGLRFRRAP